MRVVYTPSHLGHDITTETFMGQAIPANEVAERAEIIRPHARGGRRLRAGRPDRARRGPDHRGPRRGSRPLPRGRVARGPAPAAGGPVPVGRHVPEPLDVRGHEPRGRQGAGARARARGRAGRVLGAGLRRTAGRGDVRRRARGRGRGIDDRGPRAGRGVRGLRPVPAARPSRGAIDVRRLLLLQQRGDRGGGDHRGHRRAGRHPRRRLPPRERHAADLLAARRRPLRLDPRRPAARLPVLPRPCRRDGGGGWASART